MSLRVGDWQRSRWLPLALVVCGLALAGCTKSEPTGTVKGTVTLDGAPYENAAVCFLDLETGQAASAEIQPGGTFSIDQPLPVGTYSVYLAPKAPPESDQPVPVTMDASVPDKYWSEAATDIKIPVTEGANDVKVELKKA